MILADTGIWIDHFRKGDKAFSALLEAGQVMTHECVIAELALGNLRKRDLILQSLHDLPLAERAEEQEILRFIEKYALAGSGIGYVDAHLLASSRLNNIKLWTRDKKLLEAARKLRVAYNLTD